MFVEAVLVPYSNSVLMKSNALYVNNPLTQFVYNFRNQFRYIQRNYEL